MDLFLVSTPFQYLCANEARERYNSNSNLLVIVEQSSKQGTKQLELLLKKDNWSEVLYLKRKKIETSRTIKKIHAISTHFERMFFSVIDCWRTQMIIKNTDFSSYIYLDDGMKTLADCQSIIFPQKPYHSIRLSRDLRVVLHGLKPTYTVEFPQPFELFSIFELPDSPHPVTANSLSSVRGLFSGYQAHAEAAPCGFIGQYNVNEVGGVKVDCYIRLIENFKKLCDSSQLVYFPHRSESSEVANKVKAIDGVVYHKSEYPLEIELADKNIQLSSLGGFTSCALYTLFTMYPEIPFYSVKPQREDYDNSNDSLFKKDLIYKKQFSNANIREFE